MNTAREHLAQIAQSAESQYSGTRLAANHAHVTRRVRRDRTARAAVTTLVGVGVVGGASWGELAAFGTPGATASNATTPTPANDAPPTTSVKVSLAPGETLDAWATDASATLALDKQALLDAIAAAAPGEADPEGWIKPGSYTLSAVSSTEEIAQSLVAQRVSQLKTLGVPEEQWQDVITEASIIEAEAPLDTDKPKVARVIDNRLSESMMLQLDSTVKYVAGDDIDAFTSADDKKVESPYNTYLNLGLPPGAIGSPSDAAIDAVLNPADGDWLYFVTVNLETGKTLFATTYEEHLANVMQLRDWIAANE